MATTEDKELIVVTSEEDVHDSHMMLEHYESYRTVAGLRRQYDITYCDGCDLEILELIDTEAADFEKLYPCWAQHGLLAECKQPCVLPASEHPSLTSAERNKD